MTYGEGGVTGTSNRVAYDPSAFREVFEHSFTYLNGFERNAHRYADRRALSEPASGRTWTYAQLQDTVLRVAGGLHRRGVRGGGLIMVELFNSPEIAISYLVGQTLRAVFSPTNFRLAPGEVAYIVDDSVPDVLVYDTSRTTEIEQALAAAGHRPELLVAVGAGPVVDGSVRWDELAASAPLTVDERAEGARGLPPATTYDETTRLYTSGTTGRPKPVPLPSLVEVMSAHDVIMHFPLTPFDKTLNMTPLFHRGGLYSGGPNPVFYVGAENVTLRQFDPDVVLDLVESAQLTYVIGAPATLIALADKQEARARDLGTLKGIVTMGAPLDRATALRVQRVLTPRIFNGYGTTETFWNTFLRPEDLPAGAGSAGRASTDDDVAVVQVYTDRLASPTDTVRKDGSEIGEFAARTLKSGYSYLSPELDAAKFRDGWFYPGDLATWDENELVTIVGRKDDMIISGGENVHPVQVEGVLQEHDGVADSVVVGVPDDRWGELVVAYIVRVPGVLAEDDADAAAELERFASTHPNLARFKRPRAYRFVDAVPYNATGKKVHYLAKADAEQDVRDGLFVSPPAERPGA
ncbi:AMP-binding protein [Galbitalea sp. SE-J8]|uniref:class I adenylate-forming enzyme family protein n=1 Tax=Galbitalea sp. SE-J8 TaxID=3054952 RepID=UPI00259D1B0E|nr:AMP-binding protein [Galbitalea sp. SE-J8]MDM4763859.1 AMP-binding protein [Galbitalea sp. SE-J8]